jgi:hypothetical protein
MPQLKKSKFKSTHLPEQLVNPTSQSWHLPDAQTGCSAGHGEHPPQCSGSFRGSTQPTSLQ